MSDFTIGKQIPYYEQFYHTIKKMIFEGEFKPGDRINETQLAREFKVSKSPIREAIRILEKEGLLIVNEKSKVIVYEPTMKDVEEIYFCRMALESFAVNLTTKIATDIEILEIEKTLQKTEKAIAENLEPNSIIELNEEFHSSIIKYTNNNRLQKQINDLKGLIYYFRILNFKGEGRANTILDQHRVILNYMKDRKADLASAEMIKHLNMDRDHLFSILSTSNQT